MSALSEARWKMSYKKLAEDVDATQRDIGDKAALVAQIKLAAWTRTMAISTLVLASGTFFLSIVAVIKL